jgi:hypothetical protein
LFLNRFKIFFNCFVKSAMRGAIMRVQYVVRDIRVHRGLGFLAYGLVNHRGFVTVPPGDYEVEYADNPDGGPEVWVCIKGLIEGQRVGLTEECLTLYSLGQGNPKWRAPEAIGSILAISWVEEVTEPPPEEGGTGNAREDPSGDNPVHCQMQYL